MYFNFLAFSIRIRWTLSGWALAKEGLKNDKAAMATRRIQTNTLIMASGSV
jgi:hypothetical protein